MSASTPRLYFLYPFFFRPTKQPFPLPISRTEASRHASSKRVLHTSRRHAPLHPSSDSFGARTRSLGAAQRRRQSGVVPQRYGTANEPPPHLSVRNTQKEIAVPVRSSASSERAAPPDTKALPQAAPNERAPSKSKELQGQTKTQNEPSKEVGKGLDASSASREGPVIDQATQSKATVMDATEFRPIVSPPPAPSTGAENPLETVLSVPVQPLEAHASSETPGNDKIENDSGDSKLQGPQSDTATRPDQRDANPATSLSQGEQSEGVQAHKPPHISTPPYVHHFDTYSLVRRLQDGGWSEDQAITIMKAVRLILANHLDLAHEGLVSKSNVENESYLFRAACSELRTEILTKRRTLIERQRGERTQLQHEVDLLGQRVTQESAASKEELRGMFDDRKMAVKIEQRKMESKIQELNYQITVQLTSDARSNVEGLRWVLTRRVAIFLASFVLMAIGAIKYASWLSHQPKEKKKRSPKNEVKDAGTQADGDGEGSNMGYGWGSPIRRDVGTAPMGAGELMAREGGLGSGEMLIKEGGKPAFVSLG
ncbi:hypothetical protein LTR50_007193 [Elasticomyces elasticus]|nr:hypothetical protein LTR50_007193 [Elasticomyces elasticus]